MKPVSKLLCFAAMCCLLFTHCKDEKQSAATETNSLYTINVLTVGKQKLTQYEFEKNFKAFQGIYRQQHHTSPDSTAIRTWINDFVDQQYFLADAYAKGYNSHRLVKDRTESMARFIVSQPNGLLEQQIVGVNVNSNLTGLSQNDTTVIRGADDKRKQIIASHNLKILKASQLKVNGLVLFKLSDMLKQYKDMHTFDKSRFGIMAKEMLMTYKIGDASKSITVNQFMDYYNLLPIRRPVGSYQTIRYYLESMVIDDYDYEEAEKSGITQQPQYLLDKHNYANSLIYKQYELHELAQDTTVKEEELQKLYFKQKPMYKVPAQIVASLYYFDNRIDAFNALLMIRKNIANTNYIPEKVKKISRHLTVTRTTPLADNLKNVLYSLQNGQLSRPVDLGNSDVIVIREASSGQRLKDFAEVRHLLVQQVRSERLAVKKQLVASRLKKLYPLKDNINYKTYLR